jgi:molecular chaperone GrpE
VSQEPRISNHDTAPEPVGASPFGGSAGGPDPVPTDLAEPTPTGHELGLELPEDASEAQAILLRELAEARQEAGEHLDTLQRIAADFDNFRRRVQRDQAENVERASQRVIESLLPTLDSFDAALAYEPSESGGEQLLDGMRSTHAQFLDTLGRAGFEPIAATGEPFDPKVHEAVSGPAEAGEGELLVDSELRRGYIMRGRVIRPSLVTVTHA